MAIYLSRLSPASVAIIALVANYFTIVIRFAGVCYGWFMAMRYKFNLVTYDQRPLVIDCRGGMERNLNEITAGSRQRTLELREESSRVQARCE